MATDGDTKKKFTRDYYYNFPYVKLGPGTWILDTIVIPVIKEDNGSSRGVSRET